MGHKEKVPERPFAPDAGESVIMTSPQPTIAVHRSWKEAMKEGAVRGFMATRISSPPMPGMYGMVMGGMMFGHAGAFIGSSMTAPHTITYGGKVQAAQSNQVKADEFIVTDKRLLAVLKGPQVVLQATTDLESVRQVMVGRKETNAAALKAVVPPPDRGTKYSGELAMSMSNPTINGNFLHELTVRGFREGVDVLTGIEAKRGLLGGYYFIVEITHVSFPLKVKDNVSMGKKILTLGKAERDLTFINEVDDEFDIVGYDVRLRKEQQVQMLGVVESKLSKLGMELKEYVKSERLRRDFESPITSALS
ncbi:MAG: hypothetical protein KGH49_03730 [Candidatus Micrarchaeota archaeon]|nr:hypothetical protein [Candidatus Micrarchaeota archaeon]